MFPDGNIDSVLIILFNQLNQNKLHLDLNVVVLFYSLLNYKESFCIINGNIYITTCMLILTQANAYVKVLPHTFTFQYLCISYT